MQICSVQAAESNSTTGIASAPTAGPRCPARSIRLPHPLSPNTSSPQYQQSYEVQTNPALVALLQQNAYAVPQGQIEGSWWDVAKLIAEEVKYAQSDTDLRAALQHYEDKLYAQFNATGDDRNAWGVIGSICGTNWDTDFPMTEVANGVYESAPMYLYAGEELKVRQGGSWDNNYGTDGRDGANLVISSDGSYVIRLDLNWETIEAIRQ